MRTNAGPQPSALWISARGLATGYHATDKLTPDGLLCGFTHNDFERGFAPTYAVDLSPDDTLAIFERVRSPEWDALEGTYQHPAIDDGFALRVTWKLDGGDERGVWMCNVDHPVIAPIVRAVWRHVPPAGRPLPELTPWDPTWHVIPRPR